MIAPTVRLGLGVRIDHPEFVNLYDCTIGDETTIGPFLVVPATVIGDVRERQR